MRDYFKQYTTRQLHQLLGELGYEKQDLIGSVTAEIKVREVEMRSKNTDIKEVLREMGFEEEYCDETYSATFPSYHNRFKKSTDGGELEYNPYSGMLYIWSGMGFGGYKFSSDMDLEEDNQEYGYELKIKSVEHLKQVIKRVESVLKS